MVADTVVAGIKWTTMNKRQRCKPVEAVIARIDKVVGAIERSENSQTDAYDCETRLTLGWYNWPMRKAGDSCTRKLWERCQAINKWLQASDYPWRLDDAFYAPRFGDKRADPPLVLVIVLRTLGLQDLTGISKWEPKPVNSNDMQQFYNNANRVADVVVGHIGPTGFAAALAKTAPITTPKPQSYSVSSQVLSSKSAGVHPLMTKDGTGPATFQRPRKLPPPVLPVSGS
jgi:hypothetical protein